MSGPRGYFGIVAYRGKTSENLGTLLRTANILGAAFVGTIGARYQKQASDTMASHRHMPVFHWPDADAFWQNIPMGCVPVAVEIAKQSRPIIGWRHPEAAVYILGPEDGSLPPEVMERCRDVVQLPGYHCFNVAVAGALVMYDRIQKAAP